ncbi:MAG TPA: trypsin-like peptidase domain-containing protein [Myxococcaceae bacterium]|nr:trypsin-like peptidase domain-containing protein [Myxococcaceae bacterium]
MGRAVAAWVAACVLAVLPAQARPAVHETRQRRVWSDRSVLAQVARAALPAVVSITTRERSLSAGEPQKGIGSGFVISPDGYVLTAAHVIEDAESFTVTLLDERGWPEEVPATLVGTDAETDCALLKVQTPRRLPSLVLGSADTVDVGDWVVVIGSPYGLDHSVSVGVLSAKGRTDIIPGSRTSDVEYLQTDAAINPGNSGGPMLGLDGKVVGIANAVNTTGQGIGFAVPVDVARVVVEELRSHGKVRRGWLGLSVVDLTPEVARAFGRPSYSGVMVSDVIAGSPAQRAGLLAGDIIVEVDRTPVQRAQALRWKVARSGPGRSIHVRVARSGHPLWVALTPVATPAVAAASPHGDLQGTGAEAKGGTAGGAGATSTGMGSGTGGSGPPDARR